MTEKINTGTFYSQKPFVIDGGKAAQAQKSTEQSIKVFDTDFTESRAIDGDMQKIAAGNQERIAKHIMKTAKSNTAEKAANAPLKVTGSAIVGGAAGYGIGILAAAKLTGLAAATAICAPLAIGLLAGAAIGFALTIKGISKNIRDEKAADNLLKDAQHTKHNSEKAPLKSNNFFIQYAYQHTDFEDAEVSKETFQNAADELGLNKTIKLLYIQEPTTTDPLARIHYTEIDSLEYRNIGDDKRNFPGRKDDPVIGVKRCFYDNPFPAVYQNNNNKVNGLLAEFTKKGTMSDAEKARFIEIAKALSTEKTVSKSSDVKEDSDFFDMNNDKTMSFEDLYALTQLYIAKTTGEPLVKIIPDFNKRSANVDMDGDGDIDDKDLEIIDYANSKKDINHDGNFDKTDLDIMGKYLLSLWNSMQNNLDNSNEQFRTAGYKGPDNDKYAKEAFLIDSRRKVEDLLRKIKWDKLQPQQ